jgi:hypothetical protein
MRHDGHLSAHLYTAPRLLASVCPLRVLPARARECRAAEALRPPEPAGALAGRERSAGFLKGRKLPLLCQRCPVLRFFAPLRCATMCQIGARPSWSRPMGWNASCKGIAHAMGYVHRLLSVPPTRLGPGGRAGGSRPSAGRRLRPERAPVGSGERRRRVGRGSSGEEVPA